MIHMFYNSRKAWLWSILYYYYDYNHMLFGKPRGHGNHLTPTMINKVINIIEWLLLQFKCESVA